MKNQKKIRQLTVAAFFVAVELVLTLTPIGYIPIGPINATTMHIPVILAGILIGRRWGAMLGGVFGLTSLAKATFSPGVTSFVFSPFITVGGVHGNFWSLFIVLVPRILLGFLSGVLYDVLRKFIKAETLCVSVSAAVNTLLHTLMVMGSIWLFFGQPYASAMGMTMTEVAAFIMGIITTNGIMEMIVAAVIEPVLVKALRPAVERMGIHD
ncbi:MAG: ECF transporter S component [Solobacterium sp.]|nr:ECF transporter S component [Solobacterium sp.]